MNQNTTTKTQTAAQTVKQDFETPEYWGAKCADPCDGCDKTETFRLYESGAILCRSCFDLMASEDEETRPLTPEEDALLTRAVRNLQKRGRIER